MPRTDIAERGIYRLIGEIPASVMEPEPSDPFPVRVLIYPPTSRFWFWKAVTAGAYRSLNPPVKGAPFKTRRTFFRRRNEFVILLPPGSDPAADKEVWDLHLSLLKQAAGYRESTGLPVTAASFLPLRDGDREQDCFTVFPHIFGPGFGFFFPSGPFGTGKTECLQVVPVPSEDRKRAGEDPEYAESLYRRYYGVDPDTGILSPRYHWEFDYLRR